MSIIHWILLLAVIAVVGGAYWYLRRHNGSDPWHGMDDERSDTEVASRGEALGGDSYIVGVRTLGDTRPQSGAAPVDDSAGDGSDIDADRAWSAYKSAPETQPAPTPTPTAAPAMDSFTPRATAPQPEPHPPAEPTPVAAPTVAARMDNIRPVQPPAGQESVFVLYIAAAAGAAFDGPDVHAALAAAGLKFGPNDFYHRVTDENGEIESVFCVANMVKPGTLDPVEQDHLRTRGLTLFLILPGPIAGVRAMHDMMETANTLATALGGQVLDDQRLALKAQSAQYILDQIAELDRQARLRAAR